MPARVEFRLGSIFDEPCDLLVIPSSAGGTVTPEIQQEIRKAGLPFPMAIKTGEVAVLDSDHPRYVRVAYAATVRGQTSSIGLVEAIGEELGELAGELGLGKISAPLLGAGSGDLHPGESAHTLLRGFLRTAPDSALLVISVRSLAKLEALAIYLSSPFREQVRAVAAAARDDPWKGMRERLARRNEILHRPSPQRPTQAVPAPAAAAPPPPASVAAPTAARSGRKGVFISYSHADAEWLERLQKHLRPLQREGVDVWDDTRLRPGEPWREGIRKALSQVKVAILLISADFLASDFIVTDELPPLLKAAEEEGATILPVIISPCRFERMESLSRFQAVNDPGKPLVQMRRANREKVLDQVARAVEDALRR